MQNETGSYRAFGVSRKLLPVFVALTYFFIIAFPVCKIAVSFFGFEIVTAKTPLLPVLTAAVSVCAVVSAAVVDRGRIGRGLCAASSLLLPMSLLNAVFYAPFVGHLVVSLSLLICFGCSIAILVLCYGENMMMSVTSTIAAALLMPVVIAVILIGQLAVNFGSNTVVKTLRSPDGAYVAEVIDSDQGALGGDTIVTVRENKTYNALFFELRKKSERVYTGEWGEYMNMKIYWRDGRTLIVNSNIYTMK